MVLPVLAGTTVLHNLQTTLVWLRSDLYYPKNCHTGELTFPLLFTISSFAAALIFCLWKGIQQTSTRQRYGATKHDTVTWLAVSVSLPTLLGYQRASAFVNATKLASQPLFSSDEEYKISNVPLSSCHETSRRFLRYGNFFPSTFPEVLLAHASQMTGQLSQSMQIRRARDSINAMLATIISESFTSPWTRDGFSV